MSNRLSRSFTTKFVQAKESLAHLLFPNLCFICENELAGKNKNVCSFCIEELPESHFTENDFDNPVHQLFWGRIKVENVYSWLTYQRDTGAQNLLHQIKYKDKPQLAVAMGEKLGEILKGFMWSEEIDALIPVPIHPKKRFIRGYNQSEELANGVSRVLNIPVNNDFIKRSLHTESQTKKGRFGRWDNIEGAFRKTDVVREYKHIAIIDDVITTGATLEKIVQQIHEKNPDLRISLISLAFAQ